MIINKLTINNFMAYKNEHTVDFSVTNTSPIILFLGENGHGKSTIQNASKWCLYGDALEVENKDLINRKAIKENPQEASMSVKIECSVNDINYEICRYWEPSLGTNTRASLRYNNETHVTTDAIPGIVRTILAKEISHFFFFDGETQKEFDAMALSRSGSGSIKSEIENILGIPAISDMISWLKKEQQEQYNALVKIQKNNKKIEIANKELNNCRGIKSEIQTNISSCKEELKNYNIKLQKISSKFDDIELAKKIQEEISYLKGQVKTLDRTIKDKHEQIADLMSGSVYYSPLAHKILSKKNEYENKLKEITTKEERNTNYSVKIENLKLALKDKKCPTCKNAINTEQKELIEILSGYELMIEDVDLEFKKNLQDKLKNIENLGFNFDSYTKLCDLQKEYNDLSVQRANLNNEIKTKERSLGDSNNLLLNNILVEYNTVKDSIEVIKKDIDRYNDNIRDIDKEIYKYEAEVIKDVGLDKKVEHDAYEFLFKLFEKSKEDYTLAVKNKVQEFASETFTSIISDKKYSGLRINDRYGVELLLKNGGADPLRSTGQGRVSTISLVSGLIKTVMTEGSIMMDTPFVSLDTGHREMVCKWAAESNLRVSFFMHSGEFVWERDSHFFNNSVGKLYRIRQIDADESIIEMEDFNDVIK
jgi:DNA sulfur modification protein DndD